MNSALVYTCANITFDKHFEQQREKTCDKCFLRASDICSQRRLKSACAFAQTDQNLRCRSHDETIQPWLSKTASSECAGDMKPRWADIPKGTISDVGAALMSMSLEQ